MRIPFHIFSPILASENNFDSFSNVSHKNYQLLYFYITDLVQVSYNYTMILLLLDGPIFSSQHSPGN